MTIWPHPSAGAEFFAVVNSVLSLFSAFEAVAAVVVSSLPTFEMFRIISKIIVVSQLWHDIVTGVRLSCHSCENIVPQMW